MASSNAATQNDLYLDYVAKPYEPAAGWKGKLRSEALLDESASGTPALLELKEALQAALGKDRIVYGIKERGGRAYWELYVYNYSRATELAFGAVARSLPRGWRTACEPPPIDHVMYSFELDERSLRKKRIEELHVYTVSGEDRRVTSNSYLWNGGSLIPENVYLPMPIDGPAPKRLFQKFIRERVLDGENRAGEVFFPEFEADCRAVCWAFKRRQGRLPPKPNAVYVSTLSIRGLRAFLSRFPYSRLAAFAAAHESRLDHLRFDVGYDFERVGSVPAYPKSGFYGLF
jgi:hypothetical protein